MVAVAAAVTGAGCSSFGGGPSTGAPAGPPEKTHIVVAAVPTLDSAGLYIAQQDGLFRKEGLQVTIEPVRNSTSALAGQLAGKIDISAGNYVSYIEAAAASHGPKLRILAAGSEAAANNQMIMVAANSKITSPAQLQGKRIAVNVDKNIGTLLIDSVLNDNAILPTAPGAMVPVQMGFSDMARALQTGRVDAAWMPEPYVTEAEETIGAQPLADTDTGSTQNLPIVGYVATQAWVHKYPNTAAAFESAIHQGQQIASTDSTAVEQAMVRFAGVKASVAPLTSPPGYPVSLDPAAIQRVASLMLEFNLLGQNFSTASMTR